MQFRFFHWIIGSPTSLTKRAWRESGSAAHTDKRRSAHCWAVLKVMWRRAAEVISDTSLWVRTLPFVCRDSLRVDPAAPRLPPLYWTPLLLSASVSSCESVCVRVWFMKLLNFNPSTIPSAEGVERRMKMEWNRSRNPDPPIDPGDLHHLHHLHSPLVVNFWCQLSFLGQTKVFSWLIKLTTLLGSAISFFYSSLWGIDGERPELQENRLKNFMKLQLEQEERKIHSKKQEVKHRHSNTRRRINPNKDIDGCLETQTRQNRGGWRFSRYRSSSHGWLPGSGESSTGGNVSFGALLQTNFLLWLHGNANHFPLVSPHPPPPMFDHSTFHSRNRVS